MITTQLPDRELLPSEVARLAEVRRVGLERRIECADTLALGFEQDPFMAWLLDASPPPLDDLRTMFREAVLATKNPGFEVHATQMSECVAVWERRFDGPTSDDPALGGVEGVVGELFGSNLERNMEMLGRMHAAGPDEPHWYLGVFATRPEQQGKGLGARVLAPMLARCDELGLVASLESTNPRNRSIYHRHGFVDHEVVETEPGGPSITVMVRRPK